MTFGDEVEAKLLRHLRDDNCWGRRHRCESNLLKNFPRHLRGEVKEAMKRLKREGLLAVHPSSHEAQWFLNFGRREEIERRIAGGNKR